MADIRDYKIDVPAADIQELHQKLALSKFPETVEGGGWERGVPIDDVKRIAKYWQDEFDWPSYQEKLNRLPHFETTISVDGFDPFELHFLHQKSTNPDAIPLLFIHGWPGGFFEATKILQELAESPGDGLSFHVVVPSLPNFGFSSRIPKQGFGLRQYSETCHKLMQSLGYERYASQGGDWGASISTSIGQLYPQSLLAIHLNLVVAMPPPLTKSPVAFVRFLVTHFLNLYTPQESSGLKAAQDYQKTGNGYFQVQKTRPNTIGVLLADSPVGLLAWIYEKLVTWTDDYKWTDQEICEWVSLYWFSRAGPAASVVIYHEMFEGDWQVQAGRAVPTAKMGLSYFPKELFGTPRMWNRMLGDVVFEREHEKGGHFAAWEQPEALVKDLREMFHTDGPAYHALRSS